MLYTKIKVKFNQFLFLTSLESPLNKGGSVGVWKYRWLQTAVECMKDNIEHSQFSTEEKEEQKKNYERWADVTLKGIKQRLRDSDKLHE